MFAGWSWESFWIGSVVTLLLIFVASLVNAIHEESRLKDRIDAENAARREEPGKWGR